MSRPVVVVDSSRAHVRPGEQVCVLGRELRFVHRRLASALWRNLDPVDVDLLVVAGGIAFVDRTFRRRPQCGWSRELTLRVPVASDRWSDPSVVTALRDAVEFVTGDRWTFEFFPRTAPDLVAAQQYFQRPTTGRFAVVPYSGGLDSFAAVHELMSTEASAIPLLVTTEHASRPKASFNRPHEHVTVPIRLGAGVHAEASYRSRTFLFFVVAAIAAKLAEADRVVIGECGQGMIGAALVPIGDEHRYVGSHPLFTYRLAALLRRLWDRSPSFEHPFAWTTKKEIVDGLTAKGAANWESTFSCSRDVRRLKGTQRRLHCGVCGNCLLRRIALAGVGAIENYFWDDFGADTLDGAAGESRRRTTLNDIDIARHAVLTHCALADVDAESPTVELAAFELANALNARRHDVHQRIGRLLAAHRREWIAFVTSQSRGGWFAQLEGGCHAGSG